MGRKWLKAKQIEGLSKSRAKIHKIQAHLPKPDAYSKRPNLSWLQYIS